MKNKIHLLWHSFFVGLIASAVIVAADLLNIKAWIIFFSWANYFLHGSTLKKSMKMIFALSVGIFLALTASLLLSSMQDLAFGFHLTLITSGVIFIVASLLIYLECIENWGEMVPATFLGTVLFFASGVTMPDIIVKLIFPLFIGILAGWATISGRNMLNKVFKK